MMSVTAASLPSSASAASCRYYSPNAEYHSKFETARSRPNSCVESAVRSVHSKLDRPPPPAGRPATRRVELITRE